MGEQTGIQWCHHTFNGWIGCEKLTQACKHCYAEVDTYARVSRGRGLELWGANAARHITSSDNWKKPLRWNRDAKAAGERRRVFSASLSDVFEDRADLVEPRMRLLHLIEECDSLDWMLLTKRPQNMVRLAKPHWGNDWPSNVWAGTTVEDQKCAQDRVLWLCEVPARVRFLSCEPLLGPLDLRSIDIRRVCGLTKDPRPHDPMLKLDALTGYIEGPDEVRPELKIHLVITGGESGPYARPYDISWARAVRDQCKDAGVAYFHKQVGAVPMMRADSLEGRRAGDNPEAEWPEGTRFTSHPRWMEEPWRGRYVRLNDQHGGDLAEFPADLAIRMMPGDAWS